jgi:hypothetical protein
MEEGDIVIEMTPFIFEDGNTYYFQIVKRSHTNDYHDLFVYEKIKVTNKIKSFWGKITITESEKFEKVSNRPELISVNLDTNEVKRDIKKILIASKAKYQLKNWDGFVGNIPDDVKVALKRESSLKNILGE